MELIIVVVIIGVIAGFAIPGFQKAYLKGRERTIATTLQGTKGALEIYKARHGHYLIHNPGWMDGGDWGGLDEELGIHFPPMSGVSWHYASNPDGTNFAMHGQDYEISGFESELEINVDTLCCRPELNPCPSYPPCVGNPWE